MVRFFKNYSLSLVLGTLFLLSWLFHLLTGWKAFVAEQKEHGAPAMFWGDDGYIWEFLKQTLENWQSEFLQLLAMVVLNFLAFRTATLPLFGRQSRQFNCQPTRCMAAG